MRVPEGDCIWTRRMRQYEFQRGECVIYNVPLFCVVDGKDEGKGDASQYHVEQHHPHLFVLYVNL